MSEQHSTQSGAGATAAGEASTGAGANAGTGGGRQTAGIFDIRVIIGTLLGIFGLILLAMGLFSDAQARDERANDVNLNLWTGLALVAASALFILWARLRPIVIDESASGDRPSGH